MKWADEKAAVIAALKEKGYTDEKQKDVFQLIDPNNPMIPTVNLKSQPKSGEHTPVYFINTEDLEGDYLQDINGQLGAAKQLIRNAKNKLETEQKETKKPEPKPKKQSRTEESATVVVRPPHTDVTISGPSGLSVSLVQELINPLATVEESKFFIELCKSQNLNPFIGEAYLIKYGSKAATYVVGKDAHLRRAEEQQSFNGFKAGIIIQDSNGVLEEREGNFYIKDDEILVGGWAEVHRKDIEMYFISKVPLNEYIGRKSDGAPNKMWATKPATMIRKVALVQALREAFIGLLGGMYDISEIQDIGNVEVIE